jgi:hypothetical protein
MFSTLSTPFMLALAGVVGILVGLLVSTLIKGEPKVNPDENPLPNKYIDSGYAEATRLYYSPAAKKTLTQLDGDFYPDFSALTPEQKKRVLRILQSWQEWSGQGNMTPGSPLNPSTGEQTIPAAGRIAAAALGEKTLVIPPLPVERNLSASAEYKELSSQNLLGAKPSTAAAKPVTPVKPQTIVEQINDILEQVVANSQENKRGIRLADDGHQGVLVWVGLEKFNGVDAVPYPEVQQLIRTAVKRWEDLSTVQIK